MLSNRKDSIDSRIRDAKAAVEECRGASRLTQALTVFNVFLVLIVMSNTFTPARPSLPHCLPLSYEKLDSKMETRTMVLSCTHVPLRRPGSDLFGKSVPIIYHTSSSCTDCKAINDNADITASTDSSPCWCPDCRGQSSAPSQSWTETEMVEITSKLAEYTVAETANTAAAIETTSTAAAAEATSTATHSATANTATELTSKAAPEDMLDQEMFKSWVMNSSLGNEIASQLGTEMEDIKIGAAKEVVTSLKPPPPPSDTVKGYNPWLDKPRPKTIEEYLRNFEVVFVVDDSGSMEGKRWKEVRDALATIANKTFELKVDTVSLRFLNDPTYVRGLKGKKKLMSLFDKVKPRGKTPLGRALKAVFKKHLNRINTAVGKGEEEYSKIPPLDIIVLTDGIPSDKGEDEPTKVVAKAVKRLEDSHYHPNTMGVQIVQIANEDKAKKMLRDLVVGDNGRIVDTVPYAGVVDSKKLLRILLGGVHPNIRSQLPVAMLAFEQQHE